MIIHMIIINLVIICWYIFFSDLSVSIMWWHVFLKSINNYARRHSY